mmetsp:Transcript_33067/g.61081  ORF Transcript_33067/g.61081 Transcript_33067/m.61081 type:complete len:480 (+) Transcript_33067:127-1566(+)
MKQFWGVRLKLGRRAVLKIPAGSELLITNACPSAPSQPRATHRNAADAPAIVLTTTTPSGPGHVDRLRVPSGGIRLPLRLRGGSGQTWRLEAVASCSQDVGDIDVIGYMRALLHKPGRGVKRRRATTALDKPQKVPPQPRKQAPLPAGVKAVALPPGWAGFSFRVDQSQQAQEQLGERLIVTDVPKACFSSAAFGAAASPQISGVKQGDEIVLINGHRPDELARCIACPGNALNTCSAADPAHAVGAVGKLDSPPCVSCDFVRRHRKLGLDVALQMWMKVVKRDMPIVLGIRSAADVSRQAPESNSSTSAPVVKPKSSGVYNPLRPAAASAAAAGSSASSKSLESKAAVKPVLAGPRRTISGFQCEDRPTGSERGDPAKEGQKALLKFQIRLAKNEKKILDRGEVKCRLGEAEMLEGWTDGSTDLEEVLASWGRSVVGMRVGSKRRVWVPPKLGFRDGGGEFVPPGSELLFDVELRQLQ